MKPKRSLLPGSRPGRRETASSPGDCEQRKASSYDLILEAIPHASHGGDKTLAAQFLPDVPQVHVYHTQLTKISGAPHLLKKLLAGKHPAAVLSQGFEQVEFNGGEFYRLVVQPDLASADVNTHVPESQHLNC